MMATAAKRHLTGDPPTAIDPGSHLQAVSCASASFCVAIDRKGNALTFNGSTWSGPVKADPNGLSMGEGGISWPVVSCPTSTVSLAPFGRRRASSIRPASGVAARRAM